MVTHYANEKHEAAYSDTACGKRLLSSTVTTEDIRRTNCRQCLTAYQCWQAPVGKLDATSQTHLYTKQSAWSDDPRFTLDFTYSGTFSEETVRRLEAAVARRWPSRAGWGCGAFSREVTAVVDLAPYGKPGQGVLLVQDYCGLGD